MAVFTAIGAALGGTLLAGAAGSAAAGALIGGGIGMQAASAFNQAKGAKAQAAYNRDIAKMNEKIALDNMRDIEKRGRGDIFDQRRAVARELSNVRAATAGAGLVVNEAGTTPQDLVRAMAEAGELDVLRLRNNIEREKRRASIEGANYAAQAGQFEAQRASISPFRSALTSVASSATSGRSGDILFGALGGT